MPLPGSGNQLSLNQILQEKQGSTTARTNVSLKGLSVDGVNDSSGGDITGTPNSDEPHQVSEFYGYSQINTDWADSDKVVAAATTYFSATPSQGTAQQIQYRQNIKLNFKGISYKIRFNF